MFLINLRKSSCQGLKALNHFYFSKLLFSFFFFDIATYCNLFLPIRFQMHFKSYIKIQSCDHAISSPCKLTNIPTWLVLMLVVNVTPPIAMRHWLVLLVSVRHLQVWVHMNKALKAEHKSARCLKFGAQERCPSSFRKDVRALKLERPLKQKTRNCHNIIKPDEFTP